MNIKIAIFKVKQIRKTIHNNEWYFVIEDVVTVEKSRSEGRLGVRDPYS